MAWQDVKPSAKPPPTISRTRKIGIANSHLNDVETEKMVPPKVTLGMVSTMNMKKQKMY